jgi:protein-S-isoprenylcysteine O-methyltransferase Ste14
MPTDDEDDEKPTAHAGVSRSAGLALRNLLWTVLLPGVIAGYVPWRYFGLGQARIDVSSATDLLGVFGVGAGLALLAACIVEFARSGRGTLSPVDPPRRLVVSGLYRYVRNPMYLSVTIILLGEILIVQSRALAAYLVIWFGVVNLFVMGYEEPTLRRTFGEEYDEYTREVGRWIPTVRRSDAAR